MTGGTLHSSAHAGGAEPVLAARGGAVLAENAPLGHVDAQVAPKPSFLIPRL